MQQKTVVMFFPRKVSSVNAKNPFPQFPHGKQLAFEAFFQEGMRRGFSSTLVQKQKHHISGALFSEGLLYTNNGFVEHKKSFCADAIYDKSIGLDFPSREAINLTINPLQFKRLCASKIAMYKLLKKFMPYSKPIYSNQDLIDMFNDLDANTRYVLKPSSGFGGKDVFIGIPADINNTIQSVSITKEHPYILQEFIDTSKGIDGLTGDYHDLRIAIANGEMCFAHLRTPKNGSLLANVKMGGNIRGINIQDIPERLLKQIQSVQAIVDKQFNNPIYSIDCGIQKENLYVFELNDTLGFPSNEMIGAEKFIKNIWDKIEHDILDIHKPISA